MAEDIIKISTENNKEWIEKTYKVLDKVYLSIGVSAIIVFSISTTLYAFQIIDDAMANPLIVYNLILSVIFLSCAMGGRLLQKQDIQFENQSLKFIVNPCVGLLCSFILAGIFQGIIIGIMEISASFKLQLHNLIERLAINVSDHAVMNGMMLCILGVVVSICLLMYQALIPDKDRFLDKGES